MEILEINDLAIETTEMSVNRNAFMQWVDDNDYRWNMKMVCYGGSPYEVDYLMEWKEYFECGSIEDHLQQYITETFTRNQSQLQYGIQTTHTPGNL